MLSQAVSRKNNMTMEEKFALDFDFEAFVLCVDNFIPLEYVRFFENLLFLEHHHYFWSEDQIMIIITNFGVVIICTHFCLL